MTVADNSEVLVAIARLDGKLDLALAETAALKATDADHEGRIRTIEAKPVPDEETDKRLSKLEERRTVSPGQLWTGLLGVAGLILTVLTIADRWSALFGG
ncbi:hypothetical protein [Microbacterium sp. YJN-G]|uniref:hypothetical protein n=1 Tax=Microbacterium sp. YJN-G TaxID=2763257 RepID=UPI0018787A68|nr:hypothetical protein [Microbacterium sp. YJN-G]